MYYQVSQPLQLALDNSSEEAVGAAQNAIKTFEWAIRVISDPAYHDGMPDNVEIVNKRLQSFYAAVQSIPESEARTYFNSEWSKIEERLKFLGIEVDFVPSVSK